MPVAEIISIGSELLLGHILNSNAQYLAQELTEIGIDCYWQVTVGDNTARIKECLKQALSRSDIVITTGGLGPTADDLTTDCIAELFQVEQVFAADVLEQVEAMFKRRGWPMPQSNAKQAWRPRGSEILPNPVGTAPGIIWQIEQKLLESLGIADAARKRVILTFPGVPSEMKTMWGQTAKSFLAENFSGGAIFSCQLKHFAIGESALAEKYEALLALSNPTVAPLAGQGECRLRVTAKAKTQQEAQALVMPVVEQIRGQSGVLCYGFDDDTLEQVVGRLLIEQGLTLAVAESCTGGLCSKRLTDVPGSSKYIKLNMVTYANEMKVKLLGVSRDLLSKYGAVSAQCAQAMAQGIQKLAGADLALGITGVAGPDGGTAEKPVGLVYVSLVSAFGQQLKMLNLGGITREDVRHRTVSEALNMVRLLLLDKAGKNNEG